MVTAECFIAAGLLVGVRTLFRERFNATTPFRQVLGADAYGAYLVHVPLVVGLQYANMGIPAVPAQKFLLVTLIGTPVSFLVSHYLLKIPGARRAL
ncbi:MAG: hypothetical protein WAW37_06010 [Syntrophobacteraceae bacterium]